MNKLQLLRHADASWDLAGELDFERALTERGMAQCVAMQPAFSALDPAPDLVICSGARRTRETLDGIAEALPKDARVEYEDAVYGADVAALVAILRRRGQEHKSVLLIGHNPTIHDLAVELAQDGPALAAMAGRFPKCALAELEFDVGWAELARDCARLINFTVPELPAADK